MLALEIEAFRRAKPGEERCGDDFSVTRGEDFCTVAVADGLGHGALAGAAASAAVELVAANAREDLASLVLRLDRALVATRGAAASVLRFDLVAHRLEYAGIGNVELSAVAAASIRTVNCAGYLGGRTRKVLVSSHRLSPGDLLAIFTDGVSSRLPLADYCGMPAAEVARAIVAAHGKSHDDATCVVVRAFEAADRVS